MIIWSGHGILIPIFGVLGWLAGSVLGALLGGVIFRGNGGAIAGMGMICGGIGSAAVMWLYALTIGKSVEQTYLDPATHRPVLFRKSHTFFFIPAFAWAVIGTVGGLVLGVMGVIMWTSGKDLVDNSSTPGAAELHEAERTVSSKNNGIANGNTETAVKMASLYSDFVLRFRKQAIEQTKSSSMSMSGGQFLTYCQVSEHGTAFIVHVPDLRKFTREAKDVMCSAAWAAAQFTVESQRPRPRKLAVAVRGVVLYEKIMIGHVAPGQDKDLDLAVESEWNSNETGVLNPFFASPAMASQLVPMGSPEVADSESSAKVARPAKTLMPGEVTPVPPLVSSAPTQTPTPTPPTVPASASTRVAAKVSLPTPVKEWKSADGRPLRAALVRFTDAAGTTAEFKREDGVVFTITIDKFSAEDMMELQRIFAGTK